MNTTPDTLLRPRHRQVARGLPHTGSMILIMGLLCGASARADVITTTPLQVGGFLDGGIASNDPVHQNYFVGYGTVGGFRSSERRSFFWYHIPAFPGAIEDVTIKLENLADTSLIFGAGPDPHPEIHDATEEFLIGATTVPASDMITMGMSAAANQAIFDGMDDHPIADPYVFSAATMYTFPMVAEIHLNSFGISLIDSHRGMDIVLTGWMPTWSDDARTDGMGHYLEGDELIFGLSDVGATGGVPFPELAIAYSVPALSVPEPSTMVFGAVVFLGICFRRIRS